MQVKKIDDHTTFKQLKGIQLAGEYRSKLQADNVSRIIDSIRSNQVFQDIFSRRDGYIVLDKSKKTYNAYGANISHHFKNTLSIYFDIPQKGFFTKLLRAGRAPLIFNLINVSDHRCDWNEKELNGDIEDQFNSAIRSYNEEDFDNLVNSIRKSRGELPETPQYTREVN